MFWLLWNQMFYYSTPNLLCLYLESWWLGHLLAHFKPGVTSGTSFYHLIYNACQRCTCKVFRFSASAADIVLHLEFLPWQCLPAAGTSATEGEAVLPHTAAFPAVPSSPADCLFWSGKDSPIQFPFPASTVAVSPAVTRAASPKQKHLLVAFTYQSRQNSSAWNACLFIIPPNTFPLYLSPSRLHLPHNTVPLFSTVPCALLHTVVFLHFCNFCYFWGNFLVLPGLRPVCSWSDLLLIHSGNIFSVNVSVAQCLFI